MHTRTQSRGVSWMSSAIFILIGSNSRSGTISVPARSKRTKAGASITFWRHVHLSRSAEKWKSILNHAEPRGRPITLSFGRNLISRPRNPRLTRVSGYRRIFGPCVDFVQTSDRHFHSGTSEVLPTFSAHEPRIR